LPESETEAIEYYADVRFRGQSHEVKVRVTNKEGGPVEFLTTCRIDTPVELEYYRNGGILQTVLRRLLKA